MMVTEKRLEKLAKLQDKIQKAVSEGRINENATPLEWCRFAHNEGEFLPIGLDKAGRETHKNFDQYVYGDIEIVKTKKCFNCDEKSSFVKRGKFHNIFVCDNCMDNVL